MHISENVLPLTGSLRALVAGCFFYSCPSCIFQKIIKVLSAELTTCSNVSVTQWSVSGCLSRTEKGVVHCKPLY